jgi:hypothetical protein
MSPTQLQLSYQEFVEHTQVSQVSTRGVFLAGAAAMAEICAGGSAAIVEELKTIRLEITNRSNDPR